MKEPNPERRLEALERAGHRLEFIRPTPGTKPFFHSAALAGEGGERFFFRTERRLTCIEDIRSWTQAPTLKREGFMLLRSPPTVSDLKDDEAVAVDYRAEIERLVADVLGAEEVKVFDFTRRSDAPDGADNPDGTRKPAGRIHVDYTTDSGLKRARDVLGRERVEGALAAGQHIVQVNVWRPLVGPVLRSPLALADASSIDPGDLIATDQVFLDRVGEIYHLAYAPGQRFAYASHMLPEEVILIKGFDSRVDGRARFTPHSAFALPDEEAAPARHSIEARTFAVLPGSATYEV